MADLKKVTLPPPPQTEQNVKFSNFETKKKKKKSVLIPQSPHPPPPPMKKYCVRASSMAIETDNFGLAGFQKKYLRSHMDSTVVYDKCPDDNRVLKSLRNIWLLSRFNTGSKQQSPHTFNKKSFKQRAGAGQIQCLWLL